MKIRLDYITNSSSSSFIVIGKSVNIEDIDIDNGKYICSGIDLCDGNDVFILDKEMFEYIKSKIEYAENNNINSDYLILDFYKQYHCIQEDGEELTIKSLLSKVSMDEKIQIIAFEQDNRSCESLYDVQDRYD